MSERLAQSPLYHAHPPIKIEMPIKIPLAALKSISSSSYRMFSANYCVGVGSSVAVLLSATDSRELVLLGRSGRTDSSLIATLIGQSEGSLTFARTDVSSSDEVLAVIPRHTATLIHSGKSRISRRFRWSCNLLLIARPGTPFNCKVQLDHCRESL